MTDPNKFNPWPDEVTVRCARCTGRAAFRCAFSLVDASGWQAWQPRLWPGARATDWQRVHQWQPGDPPPEWRGWIVIEHDAALHRWKQPPEGHARSDLGIILCAGCVERRRHELRWPQDAWYRFELRQGVLWAWDRRHADALVGYLASAQRDPAAHGPFHSFLLHVPSRFLAAAERDEVVHRLRRQLAQLDGA